MKNFQELYDVSDMKIAKDVRRTFNAGLSRVAIKAPSQIAKVYRRIFKGKSACAQVVYKTLKLEYAIQVWYKAALISKCNPGDGTFYYWRLHWVNDETPFRHLEFCDFYRNITVEALTARFWHLLEDIANSHDIKVTEGSHFYHDSDNCNSVKIYCDVIVDSENAREICVGDVCNYPFCKEEKSFTWEEIKDFFCELTLPQLELVHYKEIQRVDELDKPLFDACKKLDIDGIQKAIDNGAKVNCFNESGLTPIVEVIETLGDCCIRGRLGIENQEAPGIKTKVQKCINVLDFLMSKGADVNFFGCELGDSALVAAWYTRSKDLIKYLIDKGANPNANCMLLDYIEDGGFEQIRSSVMECIDWLIGEDYGVVEQEIERQLRMAGARLYFGDYVPWEYTRIGKYVVRILPNKKNNNVFVDNAGWYIGSAIELKIEDDNGEILDIDISSVNGLQQWIIDYQENIVTAEYDWESWKKRGEDLAIKVGKLLPDNVALYYLSDSKDIICRSKWAEEYELCNTWKFIRIK